MNCSYIENNVSISRYTNALYDVDSSSSGRGRIFYENLFLIEVVGTIYRISPHVIFTKCFKMSVDESQWTHGFDVNWCDHFIMNFKTKPSLIFPVLPSPSTLYSPHLRMNFVFLLTHY